MVLVERQLCTLLRQQVPVHERLAAIDTIDDEGQALAGFAGDQRMLQMLAAPLEHLVDDGHPAAALRDLALQLRAAIATRNRALLADYHALAGLLEGEGIPVLPLKGVAALLDGCYPEAGERLINDVDVLISPTALGKAMARLAAAGYRQAVNRFEPPPEGTDMFGDLDIQDFRNQVPFVDAHVPRILGPKASFNVEVHIHVTTQRSAVCDLLDQRAAKTPDSLFHLLHNFEHSHLKDGHAALGLLDWRHLVDADRRLASGDAAELAAEMMNLAETAGVAPQMAVHLWQLAEYLGTPKIANPDRDERYASAIARFQRVKHSRLRQRLERQRSLIARVGRGFMSQRVRDERYGPVPIGQQLLRTWRFYRREMGR